MVTIGFIIFTIISAAIMSMMFLKIIEDKKTNEGANQIINNLENESRKLQREINIKQNQISYLAQKNQDWTVLRFWQNDIETNLQECIKKIQQFV